MKTEKSKNLIVIIGNGFDLAHGLKTKFGDFAKYYLNEIIINQVFDYQNNPKLLNKVLLRNLKTDRYFAQPFNKSMNKSEFLDSICYYVKINDKELISSFLNSSNEWVSLLISNAFLGKLYSNSYKSWFDIEQAYYDELLNIFYDKDGFIKNEGSSFLERIDLLNLDLQEIKEAFANYLRNKIKPVEDKNVYYSFSQHFKERENISFINFNYTETVSQYFRLKDDIDLKKLKLNIKNIYIHNSINEDVIFGYGDDTDADYQKIKMAKNDEFLRNFKTFSYLKSKNYRRVLNELASFKDGYDVLIIGHSLALTDKTILKTILDNNSCKNIELLKRSDIEPEEEKEESLFKLYANLSRIFDSEVSLREKVIPFEWSVNFPIMTNSDSSIIFEREKELFTPVVKKRTRVKVNN